MPLKHSTETLLVFFLGIAIILAGVACALLPPLSVSAIPWAVVFVISIVYPLSLYPLFKERRADYAFRALHFVPAFMLLVWFLLQLLLTYRPGVAPLLHWYTWGWSLPVVCAGLLVLAWFCFRVIRQWTSRIGLLLLLFVPFLLLGIAGERMQWPDTVVSLLWHTTPSGSGAVVAVTVSSSDSSNLSRSSDETEEAYRAELRRMARRQVRLLRLQEQPLGVHSATDGVMLSEQTGSMIAATDPTKPKPQPPHLPSSGFGIEGIALVMFAAYCAVLHRRACRRSVTRYS